LLTGEKVAIKIMDKKALGVCVFFNNYKNNFINSSFLFLKG